MLGLVYTSKRTQVPIFGVMIVLWITPIGCQGSLICRAAKSAVDTMENPTKNGQIHIVIKSWFLYVHTSRLSKEPIADFK